MNTIETKAGHTKETAMACRELGCGHAVVVPELLHALAMALPYVETAELDPAYKPGAVAKISQLMRDAIAKAKAEGRA